MASQVQSQVKKARLRVRGGVSVGVRRRERGD
jgi:hypothetical protein